MNRYVLVLILLFWDIAPVHAQVCTAAISGVTFGSISPATDSSSSATGTVTVTCTGFVLNLPVRACINFGTGSGGTSYAPRIATAGAASLNYNLYSDPAGSAIWGSRMSSSYGAVALDVPLVLQLGTASGSASATIYGKVAAGQTSLVAGVWACIRRRSPVSRRPR